MNLRAIYDELETLPQEEHHYEFAMTNWRERAACALAYCYEHGEGGLEMNLHEAFKWYKVSARRGNRENQWKVANWYLEGKGVRKSYACAMRCFTKFAGEGNAEAMYKIGLCHHNGWNSSYLEWRHAGEWYRKAAELGYPPAMYELATCYQDGLCGIKKDTAEAMKWLRKAAGKGYLKAQTDLAFMLDFGFYGVERNYEEAMKWYIRAAKNGDPHSQYRYAMYLYLQRKPKGWFERRNYRAIIYWFTQAARNGCKHSPYYLGDIYESRYGYKSNPRKAAYWYNVGASRGNEFCRSALERLEKEWSRNHRVPLLKD